MIPFFRKIRKQLADDNKPMKYLWYAIGEIALVVIGILIALQINNWNESKKQEKNKNTIYKKKAAANIGNRCTGL
jgi:bacteriorhodopsin